MTKTELSKILTSINQIHYRIAAAEEEYANSGENEMLYAYLQDLYEEQSRLWGLVEMSNKGWL